MNRISRRSAAETAEALLEAGRTQPALKYDVELGFARHQQWLRSEAPVPEWATVSGAASSMSVVAKTVLSAVVLGTLATGAWYAHNRPQPSAAVHDAASPRAESVQAVAPGVREESGSPPDAWLAMTPLPVSDLSLHEAPAHRVGADRRKTRGQRAHKEAAAPREAHARSRVVVSPAEAERTRTSGAPAPAQPATLANDAPSGQPALNEGAAAAAPDPAPEHEAVAAAQRARPEPAPQAQGPNDLAEMKQVATAEQLLERSPDRALALVHQADAQFPRGYFQQERAYIAIMALIRLGRIDEARARAASFAKRYPALPYGARIRSALDAQGAASVRPARGAAP